MEGFELGAALFSPFAHVGGVAFATTPLTGGALTLPAFAAKRFTLFHVCHCTATGRLNACSSTSMKLAAM